MVILPLVQQEDLTHNQVITKVMILQSMEEEIFGTFKNSQTSTIAFKMKK